MSELYSSLMKGREPLQQAIIYAVIKKINERDVKGNKKDEVVKAINNRCQELDFEDLKQVIADGVFKTGQNFWRDRSSLAIVMERELIKKTIINSIQKEPYLQEIKTDILIQWAQLLALNVVAEGLKTSQIRKFLSGVRGVEVKVKRLAPEKFSRQDVAFLKVHLAYAKARQNPANPQFNQNPVKALMDVMTVIIDKIRDEGLEGLEDFKVFVHFVEAVVAYHKFYGGSE